MLKKLFNKLFDYEITGEYYDTIKTSYGHYEFKKKYNKRYYLKCYRDWKKKRLHKVNKDA